MSFFSSSPADEFKKKFTEAFNTLSSYSYGNLRLSDNLAEAKINLQFQELIEIAKRFDNPFNVTFTFYISSVFGEKISIAEGLIMLNHCMSHVFFAKERLTQSYSEQVLNFARNDVRRSSGQIKIGELLG